MNGKYRIIIAVCLFAVLIWITRFFNVISGVETVDIIFGSDCNCISSKSGETYNFCYLNGTKFDCSFVETLENLNLIGETRSSSISVADSIRDEEKVVFVSAASDDHFNVSMKSLESLRKFYPHHKFVLFGLNLDLNLVKKLPADPHLDFRPFDASSYPEFVTNWRGYHFKGLVMAEAVKEFPIVFWIDANVHIRKPGMVQKVFKEYSENSNYAPIVSFKGTTHSNFAVLHLDLLNYFPAASMKQMKTEMQVGTTLLYVARTEYVMDVVKWWALCSLTKECSNPEGAQQPCHFKRNSYTTFANCFRYDQSILNILLLNDYQSYHKYYMQKLADTFLRIN